MVSLKDWFPYLPKMIFINYVSSYQCWVISNFFKNPLIQVFKKFTRLTSNFFLKFQKIFPPQFQGTEFHTFQTHRSSKAIFTNQFPKVIIFQTCNFCFFNFKKLHKNVESKETKTTKPKEMPTNQGAKVVEPRKVLMNKTKAKKKD